MLNQQLLCDFDSKVISGREKMAEVKTPFIEIQGKIIISEFSEEFNRRLFFDITKYKPTGLMFCNLSCLQAYIDFELTKVKPKIMEAIQKTRINWDTPNY